MRYTVTWDDEAEDELAAIWNNAADKDAVTAASNTIEYKLKYAPADQGESRDGVTRIYVEKPLVVVYEIREADRIVNVVSIRHL